MPDILNSAYISVCIYPYMYAANQHTVMQVHRTVIVTFIHLILQGKFYIPKQLPMRREHLAFKEKPRQGLSSQRVSTSTIAVLHCETANLSLSVY